MSYRVVEHYGTPGLPTYRGNGTPFGVIGGHSTETDAGEQALYNVLAWMAATGEQRGASYHELWAWTPEKPDDFLAVRIVPPNRAAGSVGIGHTLNLDAWARACLNRSGNANDPNQGIYATAIVGRSKTIRDVWANDRRFVRFVHRRLVEIREESKRWQAMQLDRIAEHFRFQPTTRSDWGRLPANLTLEQRRASPADRAKWHSSLADALGGLIVRDALPADEVADVNSYLRFMTPIANRTARLRAGATARSVPAFDPKDYAAGKLFVLSHDSGGPALGWVEGTNLTLADGTVHDARTRWVATWNRGRGVVFWHERDLIELVAIESTSAEDLTRLEQALDEANRRTAGVKSEAAVALRKQSVAAADLSAGAEAAAKSIESL